MTVRTTTLQNRLEGLPAEELRLLSSTFLPASAGGLHAFSGVLPNQPGHLGEVTLLTPETVRVNPARWVIAGTQAGTQGDYVVVNDAPVERAIGPRDATLTRLDRLVVSVRDTAYQPNEGANDPDVRVIPGTPALAGAVLPPVPPNSLVLGYFTVPPGSGTVTFTPTVVGQQVHVGGVLPIRPNDARLAEPGSYDRQLRDHPTLGLQRWNDASDTWGPLVIDRIRTVNGTGVSATSTEHPFQLGPDGGTNLAMDPNQIQARNNGLVASLGINNEYDENGNYGSVGIGPASTFHGGYPSTDYRHRSLEIERLRISGTNDAQAKASGITQSHLHGFQIGPSSGPHLIADVNEMMARNADFTLAPFYIHGLEVDAPTRAGHAARKDYVDGPIVRVRRTTAIGVANNTWVILQWNIEDHDTHGMWSSGGALGVQRSGYYSIKAGFSIGASVAGRRGVRILRNGDVTNIGRVSFVSTAAGDVGVECSGDFYFAEGDVCQVQAFQDSGASQNTGTTDFSYSSCSMHWIRS